MRRECVEITRLRGCSFLPLPCVDLLGRTMRAAELRGCWGGLGQGCGAEAGCSSSRGAGRGCTEGPSLPVQLSGGKDAAGEVPAMAAGHSPESSQLAIEMGCVLPIPYTYSQLGLLFFLIKTKCLKHCLACGKICSSHFSQFALLLSLIHTLLVEKGMLPTMCSRKSEVFAEALVLLSLIL